MKYNFGEIESKWQRLWRDKKAFCVPQKNEKPKFYILDMFPYPSGHGLHVGHLKGYVASDIVARFKRMNGFNVLHPMGWDSFGLPTERQAERENLLPEQVTERNVKTFKKQLNSVGLSYDWEREFATSDPNFFKWTQWIFIKLFEMGLAYEAFVPVNWCPALGTVLANEEVSDGVYIETGDPVEKRLMRQWMLKITKYADKLLDGLDEVNWPDKVKELQRNWIGKKEGAIITFSLQNSVETFEVFSTRVETLFGCAFCVLAPEHPIIEKITTTEHFENVKQYIEISKTKSDRDRIAQVEEKSGVFTGAYAVNPVNKTPVPIWVSDYVLMSYGTGAVFGCPGHDQRDYEFAQKFGLQIIEVVTGGNIQIEAFEGNGIMVNSDFLNGLNTPEAKLKIFDYLQINKAARVHISYNLRDWLFSRQRYWGEPIPIIHGSDGEMEVETNLPLLLPDSIPEHLSTKEVAPQSPLDYAVNWVVTNLPSNGKPAKRDTNVMPQWAGSSWYYLRFIDPHNSIAPWESEFEQYWMPVDLYVGGIEHANLHLLYARFWHKVLFDLNLVSTSEPFKRLFNQGMVHARSYRDEKGKYYYPDQVYEKNRNWYSISEDILLDSKIEKMSKSRYNVVTPEQVIKEYGADSLRLYEVFMGPLENSVVWQTNGLSGTQRFLERVWRVFEWSIQNPNIIDNDETEKLLHQTIKKVGEDIDNLQLNTAVSQLMIFINQATAQKGLSGNALDCFIKLLAPFAPHIAEEMWEKLGKNEFVLNAEWPTFDVNKIFENQVTIAIQVNGKLRSRVVCSNNASENEVINLALTDSNIKNWIDEHSIIKTIFIQNKILNLVVK